MKQCRMCSLFKHAQGILLAVILLTLQNADAIAVRTFQLQQEDASTRLQATNSVPAKCEVVRTALAESEKLLSSKKHGVSDKVNGLSSILNNINGTILGSNLALMKSSNMESLARQLRTEATMHLNDLLQSAADQAANPTTKEFLRTLRLCARCNNYDRLGEDYDGGYIICADGLENSGLVGAYSYGINGYDGWGIDVARRFKVPVYEYDCFDHRVPQPCDGCEVKFFPQCIQGNLDQPSPSGDFRTFTEHVALNGQANASASSIMLKIDVEGAEWNVFAQEDAKSLRQVRQITAELHNLGNEAKHPLYLKAMRSLLDAGFVVTHLHGNNHAPMLYYGKYSVPNVLEVSLIRQPEGASKNCPKDIPYRIPEDQRCNAWRPELHDAELPS